jgi:hypothetical protein
MLSIYKPMCRPAALVDLVFAEILHEVLLDTATQVSTIRGGWKGGGILDHRSAAGEGNRMEVWGNSLSTMISTTFYTWVKAFVSLLVCTTRQWLWLVFVKVFSVYLDYDSGFCDWWLFWFLLFHIHPPHYSLIILLFETNSLSYW